MNKKEDNLKEKFKQALISTAKVISDDYKLEIKNTDNEDEIKLISTMKKASRLMIVGNSEKGTETTDHYSMMGFTKAYNTAKKSCS